MKMELAGKSDVGLKRDNNEDAWLALDLAGGQALMLVADGVGGRDAGEVASAETAQAFRELAESGKLAAASDAAMGKMLLEMATHKAHARVSRLATESAQELSMSCTLTAVLADLRSPDKARLDLVQVGDSRAYRFRDGTLEQLTDDQTVAEQLVLDGRISLEQARTHPDRNTLSQSIGLESTESPFEPVCTSADLMPGDLILLCSDGLTDRVPHETLQACLTDNSELDAALTALVTAALDAGGHDNITVVLGRCTDDDAQAANGP
ncbi:PP2C family protein-serine/threonine phosphatase [Wenzhouxiangella marina]|uniref:PPM-type phosphatase domain-containing protein n=1 Tax=Wenzhouxiangella marina TaxID=1579979 RepID=A0A0K0XUV6_9GAMM|nr:protein phosphatase 2C domain-containing protein [Wenzhouxiangella marina]AKS41450.1 hypothetical protein WM2015_1074 [Wenzhouxiangella marina]MBB6086795.1 protein phosphatase [Wenzhouxiangella marina]